MKKLTEQQKRDMSEAGYPGRTAPTKSKAEDAKCTPGRHAAAVKEHLKLRHGQ